MLFRMQKEDYDREHVSQFIFEMFYAPVQRLTKMAKNNQGLSGLAIM